MAKRTISYRIKEAARGSFIGSTGRVTYDVQPGVISSADIDPDVLRVLVDSGLAARATKAETEEA